MILIINIDLLDNTFERYNYKNKQPFIKILGKDILEWIIENSNIEKFSNVIIFYNNNDYIDILKNNYSKFHHYFLSKEKINIIVNDILNYINKNEKILYLDTKNFYLNNLNNLSDKNCIFYIKNDIEDNKNIYLTKKNEKIILSNEKSDRIITGSFIFESFNIINKYLIYLSYNNQIIELVNEMISNNIIFDTKELDNENIYPLHTPFHIRLFCNNYPYINAINNNIMIKPKKILFDFENILIIKNNLFPISYKPHKKNIEFLKYLKKFGNYIIINTSLSLNEKEYISNILKDYEIPYDEIYFNKPEVDFYIGSNNILLDNNLEKTLGFYNTKIEPRDFNQIIEKNIKTYRKESNDLSGEIYFYRNIPTEIKDIFPILFDSDIHNKWYEMEKINGNIISNLYLNEELTFKQFENIIGTLNRIHNTKIHLSLIENTKKINIYSNYVHKIKNRYEKYDYSKYSKSDKLYQFLLKELTIYENNNYGKYSDVIHGDTVFTNILINRFGKIKMIDMRGKIEDILTLSGDLFYDWAKIYQSIIGYDEILQDIKISIEYKNKFLFYFEKLFLEKYNEKDLYYLKIITASLLFSLLPLHNNEKCIEYYNLINIFNFQI